LTSPEPSVCVSSLQAGFLHGVRKVAAGRGDLHPFSLEERSEKPSPVINILGDNSSKFARKIPWTEEPGRLQPIGSQRVGHN